jgi:hypothetical protein
VFWNHLHHHSMVATIGATADGRVHYMDIDNPGMTGDSVIFNRCQLG